MNHQRTADRVARALAVLAAVAIVGSAPFAPVVATAEEVDPKGMYLAEATGGVKFNVLLEREGREVPVSSGHRFRSGDRMRFQFEINRDAHVYVVHREFKGDPESADVSQYAGTKGIQMVLRPAVSRSEPQEPARPTARPAATQDPPVYRLLFPSSGAGRANRLESGAVHTVPWTEGRQFSMDDNPGIEKLYLIASPTRLENLESVFEAGDGRVTDEGGARRVTSMLAEYSDNASVSIGKGIFIDSYSVGVDAEKPFMTEVDLAHYPRNSDSDNTQ